MLYLSQYDKKCNTRFSVHKIDQIIKIYTLLYLIVMLTK